MFETPILLITFNRPIHTAAVLTEIKKQKPKYLFVFQDGLRINNIDDIEKCEQVRSIIQNEIDWDCELKTMYENQNLGCGYGPSKAITWFFKNVESGIILEDDCIPSPSFFLFCAELLIKFKYDTRIGMISGFNKMPGWKKEEQSYIYSYLGDNWGWAGWRRSWEFFDYNMPTWNSQYAKIRIKNVLKNDKLYEIYSSEFNYCSNNFQTDIWDCQWLFARLSNSMCTVIPTVNLIQNIGFGTDATHTFTPNSLIQMLKCQNLSFPLKHKYFKIDKYYDKLLFERFINTKKVSFVKKIILKVIKILTGTNKIEYGN